MRRIILTLTLLLPLTVGGSAFAADDCPNTQDAAWIKCLRKVCDSSMIVPQIGMTKAQAEKTRWCFPSKRFTTITAAGESEQWVYRRWQDYEKKGGALTGVDGYLYFENGILTAIQR